MTSFRRGHEVLQFKLEWTWMKGGYGFSSRKATKLGEVESWRATSKKTWLEARGRAAGVGLFSSRHYVWSSMRPMRYLYSMCGRYVVVTLRPLWSYIHAIYICPTWLIWLCLASISEHQWRNDLMQQNLAHFGTTIVGSVARRKTIKTWWCPRRSVDRTVPVPWLKGASKSAGAGIKMEPVFCFQTRVGSNTIYFPTQFLHNFVLLSQTNPQRTFFFSPNVWLQQHWGDIRATYTQVLRFQYLQKEACLGSHPRDTVAAD